MRVLFDVAHPAHVHFYRHLRADLLQEGQEVRVVSRQKEVTRALLERFGIEHVCTGAAATGSLVSLGFELARRVVALRKEIRRFRPDIVLTRNPSGVQAARTSGVIGVFDTDDGTAAGLHHWAAFPFADVITSPACLRQRFGRRHRSYPGLKALAYLHPNRFVPDPGVRSELGVAPGELLFFLRFSAYTASHDTGKRGLSPGAKQTLVDRLAGRGRVIVSDEGPPLEGSAQYRLPVSPDRLHDVLAAADLSLGDSQTVTAEAATLGTPAFHLSGFSGRIDYLRWLEERFGLVESFPCTDEGRFLQRIQEATSELPALAARAAEGRDRLLAETVDVTSWYRDLVHELVTG